MQRFLIPVLACCCLVLAVPSADAAVACFDWDCSNSLFTCDFDASCSEGEAFIYKYDWTWGDGTGTGWTGVSTPSHTYTNNECWANVTLEVIPWSEDPVSVTCQIIVRNCWGPPQSLTGNCSSS